MVQLEKFDQKQQTSRLVCLDTKGLVEQYKEVVAVYENEANAHAQEMQEKNNQVDALQEDFYQALGQVYMFELKADIDHCWPVHLFFQTFLFCNPVYWMTSFSRSFFFRCTLCFVGIAAEHTADCLFWFQGTHAREN